MLVERAVQTLLTGRSLSEQWRVGVLALHGYVDCLIATNYHRMTSFATLGPQRNVLVALILVPVDRWMAVGCYRTVYSHLRHAFDAGQHNTKLGQRRQ